MAGDALYDHARPPSPMKKDGVSPVEERADDGIVLLVANEFHDDPRVFRASTALSDDHRRVSVVCFVEGSARQALEETHGVRVHRSAHDSRFFRHLRTRPRKTDASAGDGTPLTIEPERASASDLLPARITLRSQVLESAIFLNNNLRWLVATLRLRPVAVYANDLDTLLTGALLSAFKRVPLIYDSHELFVEMLDPPRPVYQRMLKGLESRLVRRAQLVITVNPSIAEELARRYAIERPTVIPNCPPYTQVVLPGAAQETGIRVVYHGGYAPDRGIEELLEAARYLDGARLFLRGLDSPPDHVRQAVARAANGPDGSSRVTLLPRVPMTGLVASLAGFDVGVIPYRATCLNNYYSSPNKLFEYMMGGLAVAAADLPELRRVVEECENGVLFDPSDPRDIAEKITMLAADRDRLERMKRNSLDGAAGRWNWEAQKPHLLRAVNSCLGRHETVSDETTRARPRTG